jgi:hypothetical protein
MQFVVLFVVCLAICALVGFVLALPETRRGQAETFIAAAPHRVIATIKDVAAQPQWRKSVATITLTADGWRETTRGGEIIAFQWTRLDPDHLELAFTSAAGYAGTGSARLRNEAGSTHVLVVEEARLPNPITRLLAHLFFDPEAFARNYLTDLKLRVEAGS